MNRFMVLGVVLLLFMAISTSAQSAEDDSFLPTWQKGDKWVIETSYRDMNSKSELWLPPIQWVFRVRNIKEVNGVKCYVIHIFARRGETKEQAVLWLSTSDLKPVKVIDIFPTSEKMKYAERDIDADNPQPLIALDTLVPYDMPIFPLEKVNTSVQRADGFDAYRSVDNKKKFTATRKVGSLSFKRTLNQESKQPDKQYADSFAAYRSAGSTYQVELNEERSDTNIVQLWQDGLPWAASSQTKNRKTRLVPTSELQQTGGNN